MRIFQYLTIIALVIVLTQSVVQIRSSDSVARKQQVQQVYNTCAASPISNLGLCNNTCNTCQNSDTYACQSCVGGYYIQNNKVCQINERISKFYYYNYFYGNSLKVLNNNLQNFTYQDSTTPITSDKILYLCGKPNSTITTPFQFFMLGLFRTTQEIVLEYQLIPDGIDRLYLKFNLLSVVQQMTVSIDVNGIRYLQQAKTVFSNLQGVYAINDTNNVQGANYLYLDALTFQTTGSVIVPVVLSQLSIISQSIKVRIYVTSIGNQQLSTWGIHDLVIIMRKCQSCPSRRVLTSIDTMTTIILYLLLATVILVILLFVFLFIQSVLQRMKFQQKLGSSSGNLPVKAMTRVIDGINKHRNKHQHSMTQTQLHSQSNKFDNRATLQEKVQ